jgi:hypothetical protein
MASDTSDEFPLTPEEALDSDEVRNDDGDEVVDPPEKWIDARDDESLDADDTVRETESIPDDAMDHLDPERHGRVRGQIDGTPEDGDSFYNVVE